MWYYRSECACPTEDTNSNTSDVFDEELGLVTDE